jgi:hypothetical protein
MKKEIENCRVYVKGEKFPFKDKSVGLHDGIHRPRYEKEFNLKEERQELFRILLKIVPTKAGRIYRIIRKQDKEFIKKLKEKVIHVSGTWAEKRKTILKDIDKLAGDKLI